MRLAAITICVALSACSQHDPIAAARADVASKLADPKTAKFRNEYSFERNSVRTVCGEVAGAALDGRSPFLRFVWTEEPRTLVIESPVSSAALEGAWRRLGCSG